VNIVQPATPLADGTYVYHMNGTDFTAANGESDYYVAGAFTISGGLISGGEQDFIDYYAAPRDSINPNTSSLALTPDGNLEIVLDTGDPAVGVNGVETLSAAFVSSTRALIGEYDTFATSTGTLDWQNSQQPPSGGYAFFVAGIDNKANGMAFGGVLNVDGSGSISGAGSVFDLNDAFLQGLAQGQSFSASTVLGPGGSVAPDSFGRITFTLNPANVDIGQIVLIGYIVNSSSIQLVETADALGGTAGGMALGQGVDTGTFSSGNLSGVTYAVGVDGADTNGPVQLAGVFSFDSASNNVSGNATLNDIAKQLSGTISAGTYLVDTTGRVTLAGLSGATFNNATMQLYLDGNGNAFSLSMDTSDVTAGYAFQQNPNASFSGPYAVSAYGVAPMAKSGPKSPVTWSAIGQVVSDGDGNVTGFSDFNVLAEPLTANVQLSGSATGSGEILTGVVAGFGVTSSDTADSFTYYVIDFIRVFGIETDSTQLSLAYFELQPPQK